MGSNQQEKIAFDVVVLAAGKGTRMKSELPKVLQEACGWPLLFHVWQAAVEAGAERLFSVVGYGRDEVVARVDAWQTRPGSKDSFWMVEQAEQLGTGHALQCALAHEAFTQENRPIVIVNGDNPLLTSEIFAELVRFHVDQKAELTMGCMQLVDPSGYGRVLFSGDEIDRVVEEKEATEKERQVQFVNGGIYVAQPKFLETHLSQLEKSSGSGEFYITDLVGLGTKAGQRVLGKEIPADYLHGVNDFAQLAQVDKILRRRQNEYWLKNGIRMWDPETVHLGMEVTLSEGVVLEPQCILIGSTQLASNVHVETGCRLENARVGTGSRIRAHSYLTDCEVGKNSQVGPMAHLRPEAQLGDQVRVGNFVEIKKSILGSGTKVSHLSYVGDAELGSNINIGCGFITCNYDGKKKYKIVIGDDSFVGSDVQAIAPVTIGKKSYIASGSTINQDVPEGALAIARSRQENKEGYARRFLEPKKNK